MKLKVLPPDWWMFADQYPHWCEVDLEQQYPSMPVVFDRPGKYLRDGVCWCETDDHRAFVYDLEMFRWELDTFNASELNHKQVAALQAMVSERMATRKQALLLYMYRHHQDLLEIKRRVRR
jgi:hypothetical protein